MLLTFIPYADWMDIWLSDRGHIDGVQDALQGLEVSVLRARQASFQRLCSNQSLRSASPSTQVGFGLSRNLPQPALPTLVWLWWKAQVAAKAGLH